MFCRLLSTPPLPSPLPVFQTCVWVVSTIYNVPFLFIYDTVEARADNSTNTFCYTSTTFNAEVYYVITFVMWYLLPLLLMSIMYAKIANTLRQSSHNLHMRQWSGSRSNVSRSSSSHSGANDAHGNHSPASPRNGASSWFTFTQNSNLSETASMIGSTSTNDSQSGPTTPVKTDKVCKVLFKKHKKHTSERTVESIHFRSYFKIERPQSPNVSAGKKSPRKDTDTVSNNPCFVLPTINLEDDLLFPVANDDASPSSSREAPFANHRTNKTDDEPRTHKSIAHRHRNAQPKRVNRVSLQRKSRRRVVRMLVVLLVTFTVLVLPNHVRLLVVYFVPVDIYWIKSTGPVCHFLMYLNSAVNPVLYSLLSQGFRRGLKELFHCGSCHQPRRTTV